MSRSKDTENLEVNVEVGTLVDEVKATVKETKSVSAPVTLSAKAAISPTQKIGVVRYLQIKPQDKGIEAIMKKKYAMNMYTISQWDKIVDDLLNRKTY